MRVHRRDSRGRAAELLGETGYGSSWADKPMTAGRAQVIALAYALAAHETGYARDSHRQESRHPALRDYLAFLASTGYTPAEVETIITDQAGGMCASDEFAHSLADALGMNMEPDPTGTFTEMVWPLTS